MELIEADALEFLSSNSHPCLRACDSVFIALPNFLHRSAVLKALELGKHVVCDKPLDLTVAGAEEIAKQAAISKRVVSVCLIRRYASAFITLKRLIQSGDMGQIEGITVCDAGSYQWGIQSGAAFDPRNGGVLADMGPHFLDLLEQLVGPLEPVKYEDDWQGGVEADVSYHLRSQDGIPVVMILSRYRSLGKFVKVKGSKLSATIDLGDLATVHIRFRSQV
jgi:predicted dehydrogenase